MVSVYANYICRYYMVKLIQFVSNLDVFSPSFLTAIAFQNHYEEN